MTHHEKLLRRCLKAFDAYRRAAVELERYEHQHKREPTKLPRGLFATPAPLSAKTRQYIET